MIKKTTGPLKLALHGMDNRTLKTMMLFLQGPCNGAGIVVNEIADADIDVFDAEATDSKKLLEKQKRLNEQ
jgi:4-hydroxybenzoate polyprenyltransferase